ncbi:MAG TPA: error-prone DNA polymerase [Azospirillaceae bacterium]|nr:error-prone DNA polymerase [Azospirillaceae bacterium]
MSPAPYAELQVTTNFSFLRGASHPHELFGRARALGYSALGIADRNGLAGIVRAHVAARETGVRLVVGCRLDLADGASLLVYPTDRPAYARLCRLLTLGKGRAGKGGCRLVWDDVAAHAEGLIAVLLPDDPDEALAVRLARLRTDFPGRAYLALTRRFRPGDPARLHALAGMAAAARVPTVATNDVLHHTPERRILQDVVTCIREGCTIDDAGFRRERFADRWMKPPAEMVRLFAAHPDAVARTLEIVGRCRFSLDELAYQYPEEAGDPGLTPQEALERRAWEGAAWRHPDGVPDAVAAQIRHELRLIAELGYAPYFLTVDRIVRFARSRGILCQGRGSAANSAVCFVLGITSIDPVKGELLFERFVSAERGEPPDIDVDFESGRREEVIQWIYDTYGRDHAALAATVIRYRPRGAVREVGKVLGLTEDVTALLAGQAWAWDEDGLDEKTAADLNLNLRDRRLRLTLELARELVGFPRHLSQHPGGFVLTRDRLDSLVPVEPAAMEGRQVVEWDKDDLDALRIMKVDILGLGMLGCMRQAFELLRAHKGIEADLASVQDEDPAVYDMIGRADTVGVFQIESRAQMSMLPRLKPRQFYDLVIQVAVVRPGPIQGDMVHPYLRRRAGLEPVTYPTPELRQVLGKTMGVPLFQEQAMRVAIVCAGFTPSEADQLRRSMATFKMTGGVSKFRDKLVQGMVARGYDRDFAERTFRQIEGFGSYGFPESHAASFALIAYASSWLKHHHPDVFLAALLNAQPMGFYAPAQLVRDARAHGVEVRPVDVNRSRWDCTLEPPQRPGSRRLAVRLGLRMVKGLANGHAARIVAARGAEPFASVEAVWRRTGVPVAALERLADADAFRPSLNLDRRAALWAIRSLRDTPLPLFAAADARAQAPEVADEPAVALAPMLAGREVVEDYASTGLSLRRHPCAFLRGELDRMGAVPTATLARARDGRRLSVAGLILVRQRPGSAKGVLFLTLEDETGHANLVVWPDLFQQHRRLVLSAHMLACRGRVQREGEVVHLVAEHLTDLSDLLRTVGDRDGAGQGNGGDPGVVRARHPALKVPTRDFR